MKASKLLQAAKGRRPQPAKVSSTPIQQLDPRHQIIVLEICRRLADTGRSVIMSLHDVGLAARYADEALLLFGDGRWLHGPEGEVLRAPNIELLYGLPVRELTWSSGRTYVPA